MKSSRSEPTAGQSEGGPYRRALEQARGRLGRLASRVVFYASIGSTNDAAASLVGARSFDRRPSPAPESDSSGPAEDLEGTVVIADEQFAGRGRRGRTWFSPPGSGLYVSVVLTPARALSNPQRALQLLTLAAGVALAEAIDRAAGVSVDLKWPNDLYVGRRKVGGILAEALTAGTAVPPVVLGFGINVGAAAYPPDVRQRATSLESELGCGVDRDRLFIESLAALARRYDDLLAGKFDDILGAWRRRAPSASGTRVKWTDALGERWGVASGIDDQGALLVKVGHRVERLIGGEVQWDI